MANQTGKISFVNIIFFVIFGVLTGVLWFYGSPIPLIPGSVYLRTFAFVAPVIGFLFGPVTGFFSGYVGTLVWSLLAATFIPLHTPLADGVTVGLSAALPVLLTIGRGSLEEAIGKSKKTFIIKSMIMSIAAGVAMILSTSASLAFFTGLDYLWCVLWIGIADIAPLILVPFAVVLLAPRLKRVQTIMPRI